MRRAWTIFRKTYKYLQIKFVDIGANTWGTRAVPYVRPVRILGFCYFLPRSTPLAVISVSLNTPSVNVRSKDVILDSITRWDRIREESGQGQWDFAFHISHSGAYYDCATHCSVVRRLISFVSQRKGRGHFRPPVHSVTR